jgi:hypothetical protein
MLASTVQFSNNDQTPTLDTHTRASHMRPALKKQPYGRSLRTQQRARHTRSLEPVPRRSSTRRQPTLCAE